MEAPVDLNKFVVTMTETAYAQVKAACDGLTDEQFFSQPTTDSNPIAWLVWHMSRARDVITSNISGENQVCLLYTSPSPRDRSLSRMPSSA